ncbi:MAG TPA: hypothetical protein VFA21_20445 [Pyrinomonadaceae bacterium]|nr:hypothetical protein [Pyrinomonadaceae bacterium]
MKCIPSLYIALGLWLCFTLGCASTARFNNENKAGLNPSPPPTIKPQTSATSEATNGQEVQRINGWTVTVETAIPEDKRKAIFFDLVKAQDSGVGDEEAYLVIAEKYNLTEENVRHIGGEGTVKRWPMPKLTHP